MNLKNPLTFEEQIEKLESHGMQILDKEKAKKLLTEINYYRFTGCALQYRKNPDESGYKDGVTFDTVYNIYLFDEQIRNILRKYIERAEVYYRTIISYHFSMAKCIEPPYDQHYNENNFFNKKGYNEVMESFKKEKSYYRDSLIVKHHKQKYNNKMPMWVIVELMSLSNISKLYNSMYTSEKTTIATSAGTGVEKLENHLHCLSVLRNKCAHAARLYNTEFNPPAKFSKSFFRKYPEIKNNTLYAYMLVLLKRLPDKQMKKALVRDICKLIDTFKESIELSKIGFPENFEQILKKEI
ncbi:MAG: Abi family protein [Clostridia bacterium]|nr:Abi family protein [Clostridia bacterium]